MTEKFIPLIDIRRHQAPLTIPAQLKLPNGKLTDALSRPLHDLRISVTDRCNFRCIYCMPKEIFDKDYQYLPHDALLSFEEITRIAKIFLSHGVKKFALLAVNLYYVKTSKVWLPCWRNYEPLMDQHQI